jgi:sulfur-oxidizing protein SoxY
MNMRIPFLALLALGTLGVQTAVAQSTDDDAARAEHWRELQQAIFDDRPVADAAGLVALDAPKRALDAALVPITITTASDKPVAALYLVIDDNPGPLAAHVRFGPAGDPSHLALRVRINQYTLMHAVAEMADGRLLATTRFVKAAGGCSAPVGENEAASLAEIGRMKLRLTAEPMAGQPAEAQIMIRHPNYNGMQMDQLTRLYTPMRIVQTVEISFNDEVVLHLEGDISLSSDPVIGFRFRPKHLPGKLKVVVRDSDNAVFEQSFDVPAGGS